ncbi:MAG: DUF6171 family protein [Lachnospiraceae bacterium]|jgi:hypothetical protein|nr:DUF6171 family protein [Lachnospiraceae bacterium]
MNGAEEKEKNAELRICRRCLTRELADSARFSDVSELVAAIPAEERAAEQITAGRLSVCKGCERLFEGMCLLCGCYVEYRAAKKNADCPGHFWTSTGL